MSLQILHPPAWLPPIGYANGISVAAGRIVFIAGQVGWDANQHFQSEELVPQFEQALKTYWPFSRRQVGCRATFAD